ncbi:aminotransferase class I/II-fold pyridoxal phosphate-dependent enzyme [Kytococcus sedentarius]|uniref:aminotransferase class I/II-fold pyridoxal phosphate-dependent enzyme n=1 Tax=Kytococcus sedentarius TaxID=1276 RepID=UPI0035BBF596
MSGVGTGALRYLRADLADFAGYSSARTSGPAPGGRPWEWLNANESASANAADAEGASRRYPDPQPAALRERLAGLWGVRPEELLVGRGSDEGIDLLVRGCVAAGTGAVVVSTPTFGMYAVSARLHGAEVVDVPQQVVPGQRDAAQERFVLDGDGLVGAVRERRGSGSGGSGSAAGLVFVATPGNPTGSTVPLGELSRIAAALEGDALLVVDEAYGDFTDEPSAVELLAAHDNVVVLRTLSKAHGLAGARIGALIARPELVAALGRVQAPYPLAVPAVGLALAATENDAVAATAARVREAVSERERLATALAAALREGRAPALTGLLEGEANFVTVRCADPQAVLDALATDGIVVRSLAGHPALTDGVRITTGTPAVNDRVLAHLIEPADPSEPTAVNDPTDPTPQETP